MEDVDHINSQGTDYTYVFLADSSARDKTVHPSPGEYSVSFNAPFRNVVGFEILEVNIPRTDYIVDSRENTLTYSLSMPQSIATWANDVEPTKRTAVFTPGDYNLAQLVQHMNDVLANVAQTHGDPSALAVLPTTTPPEVSNKVRIECSAPFCILGDQSNIRGTLGFGDPVSTSATEYDRVPGYTLNYPNGASGVFVSKEGLLSDGAVSAAFVGPLPGDLQAYEQLYGPQTVRQYFTASKAGTPSLVSAYLASLGTAPEDGWPVRVRVVRAATDAQVAAGTLYSSGDDLEPVEGELVATDRLVAGQVYYAELAAQSGSGAAVGQCAAVWYSAPNLPLEGAYVTVNGAPAHAGNLVCVNVMAGEWGNQVTSPGIVNLVGAKYIKIRCPELEQHINRDRVGEPTTAGVGMVNLVGYGYMNQRYNFVHYPPIRFHPIGKVQKLTFRLERPDGSVYDAQGVDNNILCAITYRAPKKAATDPTYPAAPGYTPDFIKVQQQVWKDQAAATRHLSRTGACYPAPGV